MSVRRRLEKDLALRLGSRLVKLRRHHGLTQTACAARAGVSKAYLSQIELGARLPSLVVLLDLAACLGVEPKQLV